MKPTVVITRAKTDARALGDRLTEAGFGVHYLPLMRIEPLEPRQVPPVGLRPDDLLVFVSRNAVQYGLPHLRLDAAHNGPVFAVGRRTASALSEFGLSAKAPAREDSEGLLMLDALQNVAGRRVIIVKGEGGRELLAKTLTARGAQVVAMSCYRRRFEPLDDQMLSAQLMPSKPLVWVASSAGMAVHLAERLAQSACPELQAELLMVPSSRVAGEAGRAGWRHVLTAAGASDSAVFARLMSHYSDVLL